MKSVVVSIVLSCVVLLAGCNTVENVMKPDIQTGQQAMKMDKLEPVELDYLLFLPENYNEKDKFPLMLFLHGAGERGSDVQKVAVHGPAKIVKNQPDFPFIVVSPQCPEGQWWPMKVDSLIALLDEIEANYKVDPERVYLTGLSMGGYGSWALGCAHPERFAAVAPICGGGETYLAGNLKDTPVWAFHGEKDPVVPVDNSKKMVKAVNDAGGNAKLTLYPELQHDSWTVTYENQELYDWMLSHKREVK